MQWTERGVESKMEVDDDVWTIRPFADGWRLAIRSRDGKVDPLCDGPTREYCIDHAQARWDHLMAKREWFGREFDVDLPGPVPGSRIEGGKASGYPSGQLRTMLHGRRIATFVFTMTNFECCHAVGEIVLDCSPWVEEGYRRRGVHTSMHEALESATGMHRVPHGRNLAHGSLSSEAEAYWTDRIRKGFPPPGWDRATIARRVRLEAALALIKAERRCGFDPRMDGLFAFADVHARMRAVLCIAFVTHLLNGTIRARVGENVHDVLCLMPDGTGFDVSGPRTVPAGMTDTTSGVLLALVRQDSHEGESSEDRLAAWWREVDEAWRSARLVCLRHHSVSVPTTMPEALIESVEYDLRNCLDSVLPEPMSGTQSQ